MFTVYENLLPKDKFKNLHRELCLREKWNFYLRSSDTNLASDEGVSNITFWHLNLMDDKLFTETLFEKICELTGKKFAIYKVYANGQTYGLSGDVHIDNTNSNFYTFLYYVNPIWHVRWGGATVFCEAKNPIENKLTPFKHKGDTLNSNITIYYPKPNTGILYKSNVAHMGSEPTRHCVELRITVSYKLELLK